MTTAQTLRKAREQSAKPKVTLRDCGEFSVLEGGYLALHLTNRAFGGARPNVAHDATEVVGIAAIAAMSSGFAKHDVRPFVLHDTSVAHIDPKGGPD